MFHKIIKVEPRDNYILKVEFECGISKLYDIKPLFEKWIDFKELKHNKLFQLVKIDSGGHGISWNKNLDLSCNELWENGKEK